MKNVSRSNVAPDNDDPNSRSTPVKSPLSQSPRPALQHRPILSSRRNAPSLLSHTSTISPPSASPTENVAVNRQSPLGSRHSSRSSPTVPTSTTLQQLREAVKNVQGKSMERVKSHSSTSSPGGVKKSVISPVVEQSTMSPSLEAAFASPMPSSEPQSVTTTSTESSTESGKTIRGTISNTHSQLSARTPSYPFPYVPSSHSSGLYQSMHQPFTTLSPTTQAPITGSRTHAYEKHSTSSQMSTPVGQPSFFSPGSATPSGNNMRSAFQGPNLYDVVLQLSTDPTLGSWWDTLTSVLHEHYKVDRASIALPADTTDIENVPWGQKALYNSLGLKAEEWVHHPFGQSSGGDSETSRSSSSKQSEIPEGTSLLTGREGLRPTVESRHSFAGYEYGRRTTAGEGVRVPSAVSRPPVIRRTTTQAAVRRNSNTDRWPSPEPMTPTIPEVPQEEDSMSSNGQSDGSEGTNAVVLPLLRALDREEDALLDSAGVNRILQRGRLVTLTRDYSSDGERTRQNSAVRWEKTGSRRTSVVPQSMTETGRPGPKSGIHTSSQPPLYSRLSSYRRLSADRQTSGETEPYFEEYEQVPTSPWAQSPAPSPAIQKDAATYPFFVTGTLDESTFSPTRSPASEDYSQFQEVEAIGIDRASTIIHIPLTHPLLSRILPSEQDEHLLSERKPGKGRKVSLSSIHERKAPIAILSILSPDVPYPPALIQSLKMLAPHLATSFQTSLQNTTLQERISAALYRQQKSGRSASIPPLPTSAVDIAMGFEILLHFVPEDAHSSTGESLASPSDYSGYSGRSRHSPAGSIVATPGLDLSTMSRNTSGTTPGRHIGMEPTENYFEVKKRGDLSRSRSGGPVSQSQQSSQNEVRAASSESRPALRRVDKSPAGRENTMSTTKKDLKKTRLKDDKSATEQSPTRKRDGPTHETRDPRHSVLHSYGADFSASFQSLPVAAVPRTPAPTGHGRTPSFSEVFDMPPPSERLLRTIIDSLPVQIFTAAPSSGRVTWVNSKFLVYRGQTPRQVLDDPWEPIHPEDLDDYMRDWHRSLHTGQQFQHKVRLRRFDVNYRWYYVRAAPLRDKAQNIVHWVGTMIDLHDQHIAEVNAARQQETAASEAKYRTLANSSPQIVFAATKTKGITFCNSQWLAYSGQTEEQAKGTGFMEYIHSDDLIKCKLPIFEDVEPQTPIAPPPKPPQPLRTSTGISESSSEASNDSTVTATAALFASANSQVPQRKLSEMTRLGAPRVTKDATGKPSLSIEVRLRMKSGEYRWHLVRIIIADPAITMDGDEETWYGTCTDINDHKELEQNLKETMDAKSRFLSNMSHEIRTPLNGIAGMANFLIDSSLTPEQLDHVNVIRASTEGLRDLINDILDLSKVEAGMITLNMDWLHIRSVIEEVNDLTSSLALDKGLELNYLVEETVPSMIKGDKFRLRQVLLNIIGNAIKFTPKGEVFTHCRLEATETPDQLGDSVLLVIDVHDTGTGFNEKEAERLFKRFSQIDGSSTRQHGGTGLGLVISMQLVELHGGVMSAKSVPGKGSTFTFSIRFGLPEKTIDMAHSPSQHIPGVSYWGKPIQKASSPPSTPSQERPPEPDMAVLNQSPTFYARLEQRGHNSPSMVSSAGSEPSVGTTARTSSRSSPSSHSSTNTDAGKPVQLGSIPDRPRRRETPSSLMTQQPSPSKQARVFAVMVVCPLQWTRMATVGHLNSVLDHAIPHMITAKDNISEAQELITGPEKIVFSHLLLVMQDTEILISFILKLLQSTPTTTSIVVISNMTQKREIAANNPSIDFSMLANNRRLIFVQKPIKPSRLAVIFDPEKSRELSTDQNQQSAQQIALSQKRVFDEMTRRLGSKNFKVLLVEDNRINQMVMLKLLRRVSVDVETCLDGVQATDKVLSNPPNYYSIILLDLMMPNKDGYQTCIDIRAWEARNHLSPMPIVALSANVLDDVWDKCRAAGFNSYLTKPVEFKELSDVMTGFLDPEDPSLPVPSMMTASPGMGPGSNMGGGKRA